MTQSSTSSPKQEVLEAEEKILGLTANSNETIQELYADRPITFLQIFDPDTRWPKKLRKIFADIWLGKAGRNIIMKAPRGGGKSRLLASLGFALWFFRGQSVVDMGGAEAQAKIVYNYFVGIINSDERIAATLKKEPMMEMTVASDGQYFKSVAASFKQVRGPHPDVLMADEVCETKDEIIEAALPMIDTSENPLRILTSTFHKIFGIFQDIWDRADELGYTRYSWDIFDVTKTFDRKVFDDPRLNLEMPDLQELKKLSKGKNGDPDGWIPIENVLDAWRSKLSLDYFLVEYMGERPSASGLILDPVDVDKSAFDASVRKYDYKEGAVVIGGLDWGFSSMTSFVALMEHSDAVKVQLGNRNYIQVKSAVIVEDICTDVEKFGIHYIYADVEGKFENVELQNALNEYVRKDGRIGLSCEVIEVVFSTEKDAMIGNYRAHFQRGKMRIPKEHHIALWQHKRYQYIKGTNKAKKKDDHVPDATMCALKHWPLGETVSVLEDIILVKAEPPKKF